MAMITDCHVLIKSNSDGVEYVHLIPDNALKPNADLIAYCDDYVRSHLAEVNCESDVDFEEDQDDDTTLVATWAIGSEGEMFQLFFADWRR